MRVARPDPGTIVGKYFVGRHLGRGGMGVVVQATHIELGHRVALKILHRDDDPHDDVLTRFHREARIAAQLESEHIARVVDCGEAEVGYFLVMELLLGHDLAHEIARRGALPVEEAVDYALQACEGVAHAHAAGLVHRDLKPSNLFLAQRAGKPPILKVLDFGISKVPHPTGEDTFTPTPTFFGTPRYTSPEQVRSAKLVDARTDQHALGLVLFEMLTGRPAFDGQALSVAVDICTKPRPNPCDRVEGLPPLLGAAVVRSIDMIREKRFADLAEFAAAIAPFGTSAASAQAQAVATVLKRGAVLRPALSDAGLDPGDAPTLVRPEMEDEPAGTLRAHTNATPTRPRRRALPWIVLAAALGAGMAAAAFHSRVTAHVDVAITGVARGAAALTATAEPPAVIDDAAAGASSSAPATSATAVARPGRPRPSRPAQPRQTKPTDQRPRTVFDTP